MLVLGGVAEAQTLGPGGPGKGYAEFVAQSAFGNVTSQNYGGEFGFTVSPVMQIFVEVGHTLNVATPAIGSAAQVIAQALSQEANGDVSYSVKQPMTFGVGGLKYLFPTGSKLTPYALAGFGAARVDQNATFSVGGTDVTGSLAQYNIQLGTDLSGSMTKPMITLGGGVGYPLWQALVLDLQFRYGHVFASGDSINSSRAGVGIGLKF
jgi:opacity protein-like surface antigen